MAEDKLVSCVPLDFLSEIAAPSHPSHLDLRRRNGPSVPTLL
jgi:hypothetical protein